MVGCEKDIFDFVSALATPFIAVVALFFAALQWYTNNRRLKHELFDRRYPQYRAVQRFLSQLGTSGKMTPDVEEEFLIGTKGMKFTYSPKIADYVDEVIYKLGVDLNLANHDLKDPEKIEKGAAKDRADLVKSTRVISKEVDKRFSPYLRLKQ
jgi:hypothetical protein